MSPARAMWMLVLVVTSALAVGCGGNDGGGGGGTRPEAERLCQRYRDAVTDLRFDQAEDFDAVARAARKARAGTDAGDLQGRPGRQYLETLDRLVPAYKGAAQARREGDGEGLSRALDAAGPADETLDTLADLSGLKQCSLDEPRHDGTESRVSQGGFPALIVPKGPRLPPDYEAHSITYPVGSNARIALVRGPKLSAGRVSPGRAAAIIERHPPSKLQLQPAGSAGDRQAPMRRYQLGAGGRAGTLYAFSGQGYLWAMVCQSRSGPNDSRLNAACKRAADTTGFLMF